MLTKYTTLAASIFIMILHWVDGRMSYEIRTKYSSYILHALSAGLRLCCFSKKVIRFPKKEVSCVWHFTTSNVEASVLGIWGLWSNISCLLLSGPLWPRVVVPVRVSSTGQIELSDNHIECTKIWAYNELISLISRHTTTLDRLTCH